jgi:peptidyl-prolyl cis-trans isomerase A (cyclophilin A)
VRRPSLLALALALALAVVAAVAACGGSKSAGPPSALLHPDTLTEKAPEIYEATFKTTKGDFTIKVHRTWARHGADRFYNLVKSGFFDGAKVFRAVPGFVVQFGISPYPEVSKQWRSATIPDDTVTVHNQRGGVTFAAAGPNTRTTQIFVNLGDNRRLDRLGFAPFGTVTKGMDVVDKLYSGYREEPTPHQGEMQLQGNAWLEQNYPKLDSIETARLTSRSSS